MDCLSLVSDESIKNFSDRWGWEVEYQIKGLISSGSSGRVRGGRETWNLCGRLQRPLFYDLFSQGWGGHGPLGPPGSATDISHLSNRIYEIKHSWRSSLNPHGSATTQIRQSHWIPQDNPWKETVKYKSPLKLDMLWELTTKTSAGCFVFTMFSCRQIYFWIRKIHSCPPCK